MKITVVNRQRTKKINVRLLKKIVSGMLLEMNITAAELGINLLAAREMTLVNETFLHHEGSTDVITFDYHDGGPASRLSHSKCSKDGGRCDAGPTLHGELFISVDDAVAQAKKFKTNWRSEVVRYVAHGVLHLLGHDDLKPELRRKMKRAENRLVRRLEKGFSLAQLSPAGKINA